MTTSHTPSLWSASQLSTITSSIESTSEALVGEEHDLLVPTTTEISRIFHDGIQTWSFFLGQAEAIPLGVWPVGILDPYVALLDAPCLPAKVPDCLFLHGRPRWRLPHPEIAETTEPGSLLCGPRVTFLLGNDGPVRCGINPDAATILSGSSARTRDCHAVLTMCWSYILSVRLLEMQGRQVRYSKHRLWPKSKCDGSSICLDGASITLTRWLCGILCSDLGWTVRVGTLPPWASCLTISLELVQNPTTPPKDLAAPSSMEAASLLLELCELFDLNTELTDDARLATLPPCRAAFLAALMLPFYRFMGLTPQFPHPKMYPVNNKNLSSTKKPGVLGYLRDIRYFMTLSMHPPSLGSVLWSVFWQPDIDCNLVSPWLASFIDVLDQTINSGNLEILLKVLAFRRPRVAVWWLALFLLGDLSVLHWFRRYAETQMEKRASGSLSSPDPMVSAWSGAKQSFLDYEKTKQYTGPEDLVSTEDLLRCKLVFKLQDRSFSALSWRPFGHIKMQNVEPELWPYLQSDYSCTYHSFAWYENGNLLSTSLGFRSETGRDVKHVPDDVARRRSEVSCHKGCQHDIKLEPSRVTTLKMLSLLVHDITGDRNWANTGLPLTCLQHRWLRDWQGLDYVDTSVDGNKTQPLISHHRRF